ncbi:MAG: hypothetical protein KME59_00970 [Trichormus sp. ATA11-4-KO1]|jgi:hypothetical protein|nr:hypothetical protein [Trichormus sp. ATA11-4-KO1]
MNSPNLLKIERDLRALSLEELKWLLERIQKQVQERQKTSDKLLNMKWVQEQLIAMAVDLDIQTEISSINEEFAITEMDGL